MKRKVLTPSALVPKLVALRKQGKKIVFTNGCFDLLHLGHVRLLQKAKTYGDILVIGLNTDASVRRLKGKSRPLNAEKNRAEVLAALEGVDFVVLFSEPTPFRLIQKLKPDVLVKGGDYKPSEVVGADIVKKNKGKVVIFPTLKGHSTTKLIKKVETNS